MAALEVSEV